MVFLLVVSAAAIWKWVIGIFMNGCRTHSEEEKEEKLFLGASPGSGETATTTTPRATSGRDGRELGSDERASLYDEKAKVKSLGFAFGSNCKSCLFVGE